MAVFETIMESERKEIVQQLIAAFNAGASEDEIDRIGEKLPILPCLAKSLKETIGLKGLLESNLNLSDAVKAYGEDFFRK